MKKRSIFFLAFVFSGFCFGQLEWVDPTHIREYTHAMKKTMSDKYAIIHGSSDDPYFSEALTIIDGDGNILFSMYADGIWGQYNITGFKDIINMPDSTISIVAEKGALDTLSGWGTMWSGVMKFDADWNIIPVEEDWGYYDKGDSFSDGSYALAGTHDDIIIRKDGTSGEQLWIAYIGGNGAYIIDFAVTETDTVVVASNKGLFLIDSEGNIVQEIEDYIFDEIKISDNNEVIGVKGNNISILSPAFELISVDSIYEESIKDYHFKGDTIVALTNNNSVQLFSSSLDSLNSFQLIEDGSVDFICTNENNLILSGTEWYGSTGNSDYVRAPFIKEYTFEGGDYGLSNDVGISNVSQAEETIVLYEGPENYRVIFKDIKMTVKNYGTNPVESLKIWTKFPWLKRNMDGIHIEPGEEIEFTFDEVTRTFSEDPAGQTIPLCFWTSHPDNLMDTDASNDYMCADFLVNEKEIFSENKITISPNPASNYIHINSINSIFQNNASIFIFNSTGNKIMEIPYSEKIDLSDFSSGMYFLKIMDEEKGEIWSEKIIVQ